MVEVQNIASELAPVVADDEGAKNVVVVGCQVGEYGCEDVMLGPAVLTAGSDNAEGHWAEVAVSFRDFRNCPVRDQGTRLLGQVKLDRFQNFSFLQPFAKFWR